MINVYLYGQLRALAESQEVTADSVIEVPFCQGDTIASVLQRLGLHPSQVSHLFLNHQYSALTRRVNDGDRLAIFPRNMGLLYRQYFPKHE